MGTVSAACVCDHCDQSFLLSHFHSGFDDSSYFYCNDGCHTLRVSGNQKGAPPLLEEPAPGAVEAFDIRLPACERCGGRFAYYNSLLCPIVGNRTWTLGLTPKSGLMSTMPPIFMAILCKQLTCKECIEINKFKENPGHSWLLLS